jgi:hypothetical protein
MMPKATKKPAAVSLFTCFDTDCDFLRPVELTFDLQKYTELQKREIKITKAPGGGQKKPRKCFRGGQNS